MKITDFSPLNKISKNPYILGSWLGKKPNSEGDFYFDSDSFYVIKNNVQTAIFDLHEIYELSKTSIKINNVRIWQVKLLRNEEEFTFKFAHNWSIWNSNFKEFHSKINEIRPEAIKTKFNVWSR
ncbi:MAG: hypothetical protein ABI295_00665 [Xanthomarina sp.]